MTACWAVVPAAGTGARMGGTVPKQYLPLRGRTVLAHALRPLLDSDRLAGIVLVVSADDERWRAEAPAAGERLLVAEGGAERCHSVLAGLERLADRAAAGDWVLVHDAARPCLSDVDLDRLLDALVDEPVGGLLALPLSDTLKRADAAGRVDATLDRTGLWRAQTPQMFRFGLLRAALSLAVADGVLVTDEAAAMERAGHRPLLVAGSAGNVKVTGPGDLQLAEALLAAGEATACA